MDFGFEEDVSSRKPVEDKADFQRFLNATKHIFPTEAKFRSWVRSGLRQGLWMKHPVKMEALKSQRIRIKNPRPNPRKGAEEVWGFCCAKCGGYFVSANVEVDHKVGEMEFKEIGDLEKFFSNLIYTTPDDVQILCKGCHSIKTHAERYGMSLLEAEADKKAIQALKNMTYKAELARMGVTKVVLSKDARNVLKNLYLKELEEKS